MNTARFFINGSGTGDGGSDGVSAKGGYEVLNFKFHVHREVDSKGQPSSKQTAMLLDVEIFAFEAQSLLIGMFIDMYQQVSGRIDFYRTDITDSSEKKYRTLSFEKAYVVSYEELFVYNDSKSMTLKVVISSGKIKEVESIITHDWAK